MGSCTSSFHFNSPRSNQLGYYNSQKSLITYNCCENHDAKQELEFVTNHDKSSVEAGDECYLIHTKWLLAWLRFVFDEINGSFPKEISNNALLEGNRLKHGLPKKDFRVLSQLVWEFLFRKYGGGPVISFIGFKYFTLLFELQMLLYFIIIQFQEA